MTGVLQSQMGRVSAQQARELGRKDAPMHLGESNEDAVCVSQSQTNKFSKHSRYHGFHPNHQYHLQKSAMGCGMRDG
jgi:hypothetical protein